MDTPQSLERYLINIAISNPELLPNCMLVEDFKCSGCRIEKSRTCLIYNDWEFRSLLKYRLTNLSHSLIGIDARKEKSIIDAVVTILQEHGLPLHLDKIHRMLSDRYPELQVNRNQIAIIIVKNNDVFEKIGLAVYTVYTMKAQNNLKQIH